MWSSYVETDQVDMLNGSVLVVITDKNSITSRAVWEQALS
jgi:hypothetical protein